MTLQKLRIGHIPAVLWGDTGKQMLIAVHGSHSSKIDDCIWVLAEEATKRGYRLLSFDLPQHGERVYEPAPCMVDQCVAELREVLRFARGIASRISVFGCSMGAYFSLLAYAGEDIQRALFLSPVTDMERVIHNIMENCGVDEASFRAMRTVPNPVETLYWDYYVYVKEHPITRWEVPTFILRGENDTLCEKAYAEIFADRFHCELTEQKGGEHWFHTDAQLAFFRAWVSERL